MLGRSFNTDVELLFYQFFLQQVLCAIIAFGCIAVVIGHNMGGSDNFFDAELHHPADQEYRFLQILRAIVNARQHMRVHVNRDGTKNKKKKKTNQQKKKKKQKKQKKNCSL